MSSTSRLQPPEAQRRFAGGSGRPKRGLGIDLGSDTTVGVKFVPLCLCIYGQLFETDIVVENAEHWDDREVMEKIQKAYWEARGPWKKWPSEWRIWPWKVLHKIGYAKVNAN